MITISLCMIVKNEQETLKNCLESVKEIVDEIIIVDTGSTDNTVNIALEYTPLVYNFRWINDFSAARNFSFSKATMEYILWLDADDIIYKQDGEKLRVLKRIMNNNIDVVMMKYNVKFDKQGNETQSFFRERLLKRSKGYKWEGKVHEYIQFDGLILSADISITHSKKEAYTDRNLRIYEGILSSGDELTPRDIFYYAKELFSNKRLDEAIKYYHLFLDKEFNHASYIMYTCIELAKCYFYKKEYDNALKALLHSLQYNLPSAEICSYIGFCFRYTTQYEKAIYWYELALKLEKPQTTWGTVMHDYWGFVPAIELSYCYYKLNNIEKAIRYNQIAEQYKPDDYRVLQNKSLFVKE